MAYQFTYHAIKRCEDRGLEYPKAKKLFEKAQLVRLGSVKRMMYKYHKYGEEELTTEYWYSEGYVFVCSRKNLHFSFVLTVFPLKKNDVVFIDKRNRNGTT